MLLRAKAYNAVALVDFISTMTDQYYRNRLLESRVAKSFLWLGCQVNNAAYVQADSIMQTCESVFKVPSEADRMMTYTVDVSVIVCGATEEFQLQCVFIRRVCWRVIIISNLNHFVICRHS